LSTGHKSNRQEKSLAQTFWSRTFPSKSSGVKSGFDTKTIKGRLKLDVKEADLISPESKND
jgi:hypothetical protein